MSPIDGVAPNQLMVLLVVVLLILIVRFELRPLPLWFLVVSRVNLLLIDLCHIDN